MVAVADVYDALTTVRPYKPAWSSEDAMDYLTTQVGRHFDPRCVEAFLSDHSRVFEVQRQLPDMGRLEEAE